MPGRPAHWVIHSFLISQLLSTWCLRDKREGRGNIDTWQVWRDPGRESRLGNSLAIQWLKYATLSLLGPGFSPWLGN